MRVYCSTVAIFIGVNILIKQQKRMLQAYQLGYGRQPDQKGWV